MNFPSECMVHLSYQGGSFFKAVEVIVIQIIIVITERFGKKRKLLSRNSFFEFSEHKTAEASL